MKRVLSEPPHQTQAATSIWQGFLSTDVCGWREPLEAATLVNSLLAAGGAALLFLAVTAPVYLLGLGLASLVGFAKGYGFTPGEALSDPVVWLPLLGGSALVALLVLFFAGKRKVVAFTFDAETKHFDFVEKRFFFWRFSTRVHFDSILEVAPVLMTTHATEGHFEIKIQMHNGHKRLLWLGNDIPLPILEKHCEWLSLYLDVRVRPLIQLDC